MSFSYNKDKEKCPPLEEKSEKTLVNNFCCQAGGQQGISPRPCPPTELIKNGGFESGAVFNTFADWEETLNNIQITPSNVAYEGEISALFRGSPTQAVTVKTSTICQNVPVTPGCFLMLSFAENFFTAGEDFDFLNIRARVFYDNTNLIDIEIGYPNQLLVETGFTFHQQASNVPVPANVSRVTVQFLVEIRDRAITEWLLDGVSLRAI